MYKYAAEKLCKKVAFSLRKPTALFRKMGTRIFFLEQPLVIRKIRVPLCSKVRNLFVEQSAHSPIPQQNRLSSIYEDCSPWNILRTAPQNAQKKAVLAPFASLYATLPFCWAVFHKCSTECHFMFHDDYQPINKNGLRNEIPWNTMFHAPFPDVPRNVPRNNRLDLGVRNEEWGIN